VYGRFADPQGAPNGIDLPLSSRFSPSGLFNDLTTKTWSWTRAQESNQTLAVDTVRAIATETDPNGRVWLRSIVRSPLSGIPYGTLPAVFQTAPLDQVHRYAGIRPLLDGDAARLYFIGGQRSSLMRNPWIHVVDLVTGEQRAVAVQRPWQGDVVAAALDSIAPFIVAIERTTTSYNILRISLANGAVTVTRTYTNTNQRTNQTVVVMPDGRFVFASSQISGGPLTRVVTASWGANGFGVLRRGTSSVTLTGPGAVSASLDGVTLVGTPSGSTLWRPVGVRYSSLVTAIDADLGSLF
jgi:hypothetical protein